jgi:hypothetical protein
MRATAGDGVGVGSDEAVEVSSTVLTRDGAMAMPPPIENRSF